MSNRQLFVTTDTALDTGDASLTDPTQVGDGAFAVLDSEDASGGSEDLTGTDAPNKMTLVRGGDVPQIEHIEKDKINSVQTQAFRAEQQQVSAAGFSGSGSQALTFNAGESATVKVTRLEKGYEPFPRISGSVTPKTGENPYASAATIVEQFRKQDVDNVFGTQTRGFVKADVLVNEASSQLVDDVSGANVTLDVTEDSKRVIAHVTSGEDIATLSAGDMLRIGSATDLNEPVYVADAIETNDGAETELIITLDRPYVGDTAQGVAAGSVDQGAPASDDDVGVEITAEPSEDGNPAISFETSLEGSIEDDPITSKQTPVTASGSTAQIKNLEEFSWGTRGYYYTNYFPQEPESHVVDGTDYDLCTIIYENNNDDAVVSQNKFREIHIAYPEGNITLSTLAAFFNS